MDTNNCKHPVNRMNGFEEHVTCTDCGEIFDLEDYIALHKAALAHQLKSTGPKDVAAVAATSPGHDFGWNRSNAAWRAHIDAVLGEGGGDDEK